MIRKISFYTILIAALLFSLLNNEAFCLISPIKRNIDNEVLLNNCSEIRLISQKIDLYHYPIGIWQVNCRCIFYNQYQKTVNIEMGFLSGIDIRMIVDEFYCDEFNNFKVFMNGQEIKNIKMKDVCTNFGDRIGMEWTNDDNAGFGYVNTWKASFSPEETKEIIVTFTFITKRPSIKYNPVLKEAWYTEQVSWLKDEYSAKAENDFKLPLTMASLWALSLDSLVIRTYFSDDWLSKDLQKMDIKNWDDEQIFTFCEPIDFFSPKDIELEAVTEKELAKMSATQLKILRNSFFAKYGKTFKNKWLRLYFINQPWYYKNNNYDNWFLTDFDIQNMKTIYNYENRGKKNE